MIVQGNDRILFIKRGDNFQPVGCLTSNGLDESTEFLPTTTRNAEGWETQRPTTQNYSINFSGFQVPTSFRANTDFVNFYTLEITLLENVPFLLRFRVEGDAGWFVFIQKKITDDPEEVENNPSGFVLLGATIADTVQNILENILIYNPNANVNYTRNGDTLVLTFVNSGNYEVTMFSAFADGSGEVVASYELIIVTESNPNPLISYDRLRMMKRNRELITWRIMSSSPVPQYIDEGQGYIANISDVSEVNVDASFSGSIIGYGVPLFIINDAALATGENFVEDGNDNLIEV